MGLAEVAMSTIHWRAMTNVNPHAFIKLSRDPLSRECGAVLNTNQYSLFVVRNEAFPTPPRNPGPQKEEFKFTFGLGVSQNSCASDGNLMFYMCQYGAPTSGAPNLNSSAAGPALNINAYNKGEPHSNAQQMPSSGLSTAYRTNAPSNIATNEAMERENAELKAALQQLRHDHGIEKQNIRAERDNAQRETAELKKTLDREQEQHRVRLEAMKNEKDRFERDSATFRGFMGDCAIEIHTLKSEWDGLKKTVAGLSDALARSDANCANLQKERDTWHYHFTQSRARCVIVEEERDRLADEVERQRIINEARGRQRAEESTHGAHGTREREEMKARIRAEEKKREEEQLAMDIKKEFRRQDRMPWKKATIAEVKRCQERDMRDWGAYPWTPKLALDRFHAVSNEFLTAVYTEKQPLTVGSVPWPVLHSPHDITLDKITWGNVEGFLRYAKAAYGSDIGGYTKLVKQIQQMFHPDKWRSKSLLASVMKLELRKSLQGAGNVVSQAVNQWRAS